MYKNEVETNVRGEYEPIRIRHLAIQCPGCKKWFNGSDIYEEDPRYEYELNSKECECPLCGEVFYPICKVEECGSANEVCKDVLKKKVTWE